MSQVFLAIGFGCAVLSLVLYHIYHGFKDNMNDAKVGDVLNFEYEQPKTGERPRYMAKILSIKTLSKQELQRLNARSKYRASDDEFIRTPRLVTARTADGRIRNFYAERTVRVRRPLFGKILFRVKG
jgi:hypothetical protein